MLAKLSQKKCLETANCKHFKSTIHKLVKQHKVHLFRTFSGLTSRKIKPGRLFSLALFFLAVKNDIFETCIHKICVFILLHLSFWLFFRNWRSNKMSIRQQLTHLRINSMKRESSWHDNLRIFTTRKNGISAISWQIETLTWHTIKHLYLKNLIKCEREGSFYSILNRKLWIAIGNGSEFRFRKIIKTNFYSENFWQLLSTPDLVCISTHSWDYNFHNYPKLRF